MGRPVNADADKTRGRILDSAALLFAEHGVGSTSVRDVAGAANVSLGMVNHYFGSKDGLYDACIEAMFTELGEMKNVLAKELAAETNLNELFARAIRTCFQFACAHRTAVRLLVRAAVSTGELYPRGRTLLIDMMTLVSTTIGARIGRKPEDLRLPLQSLVFLVARYAAQAESELLLVSGAKNKTEALAKVEDHLVNVALELFAIPAEKKSKRSAR